MLMQNMTLRKLLELLIAAAMLFGWAVMLSAGFRIAEENEGAPEPSLFNPLRYGFQIFLVATPAFVLFSRRRVFNERLSIGIIVFGMFSLCQPFTIILYRCGFQTLLVGTLAFIVVAHMKVKPKSEEHGI
jgi:hypothetical protein